MDEERRDGAVSRSGLATIAGGQRQHVGGIALALTRCEGDAGCAASGRAVAFLCGGERCAKRLPGFGALRHEPAARRVEAVGLGEDGVAGGVGVNDAAARVGEEYPGVQAVEDIGKRGGLGGLEVDRLADHHCAADMGGDEPHPSPRGLVEHAVAPDDASR